MEMLKELLKNIVVIVLLTTFLDMLLPSSSMRPYVKVVMGLFILVSLLNPVLNLIPGKRDFEVFAWQQDSGFHGSSASLPESERLHTVTQDLFLQNYTRRLELQMEALVKLVQGVEAAQVRVELKGGKQVGSLEGIQKITVTVNSQGEGEQAKVVENTRPIRIQVNPVHEKRGSPDSQERVVPGEEGGQRPNSEEKRVVKEIRNILVQYFGVQPQQVQVVFS